MPTLALYTHGIPQKRVWHLPAGETPTQRAPPPATCDAPRIRASPLPGGRVPFARLRAAGSARRSRSVRRQSESLTLDGTTDVLDVSVQVASGVHAQGAPVPASDAQRTVAEVLAAVWHVSHNNSNAESSIALEPPVPIPLAAFPPGVRLLALALPACFCARLLCSLLCSVPAGTIPLAFMHKRTRPMYVAIE